jgi:hypothetical protein
MNKSNKSLRPLSARQLAVATGGGGDLGNDWLVGGTGQDAQSPSGTGKTLTAALLGKEIAP